MKGQGQRTNARSVSFEVPGWREMRRRDRASIWSRDRFTEGRSGRERWEVRFLDDVNSDERSEVIAVQNQNICHKQHSSQVPQITSKLIMNNQSQSLLLLVINSINTRSTKELNVDPSRITKHAAEFKSHALLASKIQWFVDPHHLWGTRQCYDTRFRLWGHVLLRSQCDRER